MHVITIRLGMEKGFHWNLSSRLHCLTIMLMEMTLRSVIASGRSRLVPEGHGARLPYLSSSCGAPQPYDPRCGHIYFTDLAADFIMVGRVASPVLRHFSP